MLTSSTWKALLPNGDLALLPCLLLPKEEWPPALITYFNGCLPSLPTTVFDCKTGQRIATYKYLYALLIGPIPISRVIKRKCRTKSCMNPYHYELGRFRAGSINARTVHYHTGAKPSADQLDLAEFIMSDVWEATPLKTSATLSATLARMTGEMVSASTIRETIRICLPEMFKLLQD